MAVVERGLMVRVDGEGGWRGDDDERESGSVGFSGVTRGLGRVPDTSGNTF